MKNNLNHIRRCCLTIVLSLLLGIFPHVTSYADDNDEDDTQNTEYTSLETANYQSLNRYVSYAEFRRDCVISETKSGIFQFEDSFEKTGISLCADTEEGEWSDSAATSYAYGTACAAESSPITMAESGKTDENGLETFSDVSIGLYPLVGKRLTVGKGFYIPKVVLNSLSYTVENRKRSTPSLYIKNSLKRSVDPSNPETTLFTGLSANNAYVDEGNGSRSSSDTAKLTYQVGVVNSPVNSNDGNNRKYKWSVIDDTSLRQLVEKDVPESFTVTSVQDGMVFVVTDTYQVEIPEDPSTPTEPEHTQTGQLWWPVFLLSVWGLLMFLIGYGVRKKEHKNHNS
jgi:hypothetical protein